MRRVIFLQPPGVAQSVDEPQARRRQRAVERGEDKVLQEAPGQRQTGGEINAVKRMVWDDLKCVRTKLDEPPPQPPPERPALFDA